MAPGRPPRRCLAALALLLLHLSLGPSGLEHLRAFGLGRFAGDRPRVPPRLVRRAEGGVGAAAPSLGEAGVFLTEVDQITGELDVSGLPTGMGVYAVYDADSRLQYIGLSKDISRSVEGHAKAIGVQDAGALIASVKCQEMPGGSKESLKATWESWIKEHMEAGGEIPAGNLPESAPGADGRWRSRGQSKAPLNLAGVRGITSMAEATEAVRGAVEQHSVLLFMKGSPAMPQCGFSARTVGILSSVGVPFEAVNVMDEAANPGVREAVKQFSSWPTIPQLFVNGELIGGADIIGELYGSGQLEALLSGAGSASSGAATASGGTAPAASGSEGVTLVDDPARPVASQMSLLLSQAFELRGLRIVDESAQHEGDPGALEMGLQGESHFRVELAAPEFEGLSPVQRQQRVFDSLADVMPRIHALSLVTRTPAEAA